MTQQAPERIWANVSGNRQTYLTGQNINHTEPYIRADLSPSPEAFQQMREALEPFSKFAGEVFAKNFNNDHVVIAMSGHDGVVKLSDFFKARAALKAAEGEVMTHDDETNALVAAAYEDALAICRECGLAGDHPNDALTILLRGQAPSDAQAALDRIIQRAKNEALEKAANRMKAAAHDALSIDYRDAFCLAEGIIRAMKEPEE